MDGSQLFLPRLFGNKQETSTPVKEVVSLRCSLRAGQLWKQERVKTTLEGSLLSWKQGPRNGLPVGMVVSLRLK